MCQMNYSQALMAYLVIFLTSTFIILDCIILTSAVTRDDDRPGSDDSLKTNSTQSTSIIHNNKKIHWTPELQSKLIRIWDMTNPRERGHAIRMHRIWSLMFPEHSDISAKYLRELANSMILRPRQGEIGVDDEQQRERLAILESNKRFCWTPELKADLMKLWRKSSPERKGNLERFHKFWTESYPQYADLEFDKVLGNVYKTLSKQRLESRRNKHEVIPENVEKKRKHINPRISWNDKLNAELIDIWDRTYSPNKRYGHTEKIYKEWTLSHPEYSFVTPRYLKNYVDSLLHGDTNRRALMGDKNELLQKRIKYLEKRGKRIRWTSQLYRDLLDCWNKGKSGETVDMEVFHQEWKKLHPEYDYIDPKVLAQYAKKIDRGEHESYQSEQKDVRYSYNKQNSS